MTGIARYDGMVGWVTDGQPLYEGRVVYEHDGLDNKPNVEERHISIWRMADGRFVELYSLYSRSDGKVYEELEGVVFDRLDEALDDARHAIADAEEDVAEIRSERERQAAVALWAEWRAVSGGLVGTA